MTTTAAPRATTLRQMVPLRAWLHSPALNRRVSLLFALFAGYPLAAGWLISQQFRPVTTGDDGYLDQSGLSALAHDLKWLDWPFVAYFGAAWLVAMWLIVRPKLSLGHAAIIAVLALITGLPVAIWLEVKLNAQTSNLFSAILAVGGSEELAKLVPMLIVVLLAVTGSSPRLRSWLELSPRTYLYLGCVSGVAFGCAEGVEYMVSTQNAQINGEVSIFILTKTVFLRLITDPLNHALWAGISGFFLGLAVQRIRRTNRTGVMALLEQSWLILTGLAVAAVLHGVNDFVTANAAVQALVDATSALILLGYALAGDIVEQAVADAPAPQWGSRIAAATRTHLTTQPTAQPHAQPYWGAPAPVPPQPYYPPATAWTTPPAAPAPQAQPVGWTVGQPTMTPTR